MPSFTPNSWIIQFLKLRNYIFRLPEMTSSNNAQIGYTTENSAPNPQVHSCPFPQCKYSYLKSRNLKQHLRNIRGGGYDDIHPDGHPEWKLLDEKAFLKVHTRPGDLSPAEKERRRAAAQKTHYEKHKTAILERSRERREKINNVLQVTKDLGTYAQLAKEREAKIRSKVEERSRLYQALYGSSDKYTLEKFVDIENPPTLETYPRLVSFFLDVSNLPDVHGAIPGTTLMFDAIPGVGHFRKVSSLLHPDKNPHDRSLQSILNAAFDLWRPILDNPQLKNVSVHDHDDRSSEEFCRRGEPYKQLSQMYFSYMLAVNNAMELLSPQSLSL
jgi:hypothetical protein